MSENSQRIRRFSFDPGISTAHLAGPQLLAVTDQQGLLVTNNQNLTKYSSEADYNRLALGLSVFGHMLLFYILLFGLPGGPRVPKDVVYSVSLEGSNKLGGMQQVPKGKQDTPIAPPKNVSAPPPPKNTAKEVKQQQVKKVTTPPEPKEKAEIALKEKPKPVTKATPPPKTEVKKKEVAQPPKPVQPSKSAAKPKPVDPKVQANKNFEQALQRYLGESTAAGGVGFGGDGRGGRGMGGGVVKPPEWFLYKDLLESSIRRGWNWHDTSAALVATVSFRISERGDVSDVSLVQGSGNPYYDESIIRAVKKASPVPPPPAQFYNDFRFVELDFKPQ